MLARRDPIVHLNGACGLRIRRVAGASGSTTYARQVWHVIAKEKRGAAPWRPVARISADFVCIDFRGDPTVVRLAPRSCSFRPYRARDAKRSAWRRTLTEMHSFKGPRRFSLLDTGWVSRLDAPTVPGLGVGRLGRPTYALRRNGLRHFREHCA